jgi:ubiquitin carboxyl-terminal hydrolase L5
MSLTVSSRDPSIWVLDVSLCSCFSSATGACTKEDWLSVATPAIQKRIERYSRSEIRFNLLAIIKNRKTQFLADIQRLEAENEKLRNKVLTRLNVRGSAAIYTC